MESNYYMIKRKNLVVIGVMCAAFALTTVAWARSVDRVTLCIKRDGELRAVGVGFRDDDCKKTEKSITISTDGIQGPKGDKGDTGQQGIQGPKGDKGDTGASGQNGAQGPAGSPSWDENRFQALQARVATLETIVGSGTPPPPPPPPQTATGTLALAKNSSYASQTVTVPQTAFKIGDFRLTSGSGENIQLSNIKVSLGGTVLPADVSSIYVVFGALTTISTSSSPLMVFPVATVLPKSSTLDIKVFATLSSAIPTGATIISSVASEGTGVVTNAPLTSGAVQGQTITTGSGFLTAVVDPSTPVSTLAVGGTMPKIASLKFTALNDSFTITDLSLKTGDPSSVIELVFKDGATEIGRQAFSGNYATRTGLSVPIFANTNKVIDVYANLGSIGTGFAVSGGNIGVTLTNLKAINSGGVSSSTNINLVGNNIFAYKTKPTITNVALPTTVLTNGTQTLYKFAVTADAGGTIAWRKIKFNIATNTANVSNFFLYDEANQSTALTNTICSLSGVIISCTSTQDQEVSGSKTYILKATVSGSISIGSSVSVNIPSSGLGYMVPSAFAVVEATSPSFVWSDESVIPHSAVTQDWNNDYLMKNIPTDSLTLTK